MTSDAITAKMIVNKGQGYLQLTMSYGFVEEVNGVRKYRPVTVAVPGVSFGPQHWESGKRDETGKKLPAWFAPSFIRANRKEYSEIAQTVERIKDQLVTAYNEVSEELGTLPSPEQVLMRFRGDRPAKRQAAVRLTEFLREYIAGKENHRTGLKFIGVLRMIEAIEEARKPGGTFHEHAKGSGHMYLSTFSGSDWEDYTKAISMAAVEIPATFKNKGAGKLKFTKAGGAYTAATANKYHTDLANVLRAAKAAGHTIAVDPDALPKTSKVSDVGAHMKHDEIACWLHSTKMDGTPLPLKNGQENARKLFAIALLTGVRFGSIHRILERKPSIVKGNDISFRAIEIITDKPPYPKIAIPVFYHLEKILADPPVMITNQKLNEHIQQIAELMGMDRPLHVKTVLANGKVSDEMVPLHVAASCHSARRSFITALTNFPALVPRELVAKATGHTITKAKDTDQVYYDASTPLDALEGVFHCLANPRLAKIPYRWFTDDVAAQLGVDESHKPR